MVYVGCAHVLCTAAGSGFDSDELSSFQDAGPYCAKAILHEAVTQPLLAIYAEVMRPFARFD